MKGCLRCAKFLVFRVRHLGIVDAILQVPNRRLRTDVRIVDCILAFLNVTQQQLDAYKGPLLLNIAVVLQVY